MSAIFAQFLGGLTTAMFLFLIASGLSLVFGVMRVLNFAHGSFYMIGAYLAWQIVQWLAPIVASFWLAVLGAALGVALLGGVVERLLLRFLYGREELYQLLFTYALVLILGDAVKAAWGTQQLSVSTPPLLAGGFDVLGTTLPRYNLFIIVIGPTIALAVWLLLTRSTAGRMVRAAALDREMLGALGRQCRRDLYRHVRRELVPRRPLRRAGDADPEHRAGDGRLDHRRCLHRRGDRRARLVLGHVLGLGDLWPGALVRHSDLSRLLALRGVRADGGDPHRPPLGPLRAAAPMTAAAPAASLQRIPWTLVVFLAAAVVPWLGSRYYTILATLIAIDALFAVSLNLLLGTTGLVSFGHVAYFGIGAYVCGILMKTYAVPFTLALPAAALGTALFALMFGFFCVRLIRIYFAMLTLAFSQIVWAICFKWNDVTGGDQGLPDVPYPDFSWMSAIPGLGHLRVDDQFYLRDDRPGGAVAGGDHGGSSARPSGAC